MMGSFIYTLGLFFDKEELGDWIQTFFYKILITLDSLVYYSIDTCYQVFLSLSRARIFDDDLFGEFIKRFYVVVGVLMLFFVVYTLLRVIVNPDDMTKGNYAPGKIIWNIVSSIIIIALLPTIFRYLYKVQGVLLDNDVIGSVVLGSTSPENARGSVVEGGRLIAANVFEAFFYPENGKNPSEITSMGEYNSRTYTLAEAKEEFVKGNVSFLVYTAFAENAAKDEIHYSWFISAIAGAFCLYVIVSFVFDLGIRAVKLGILQIIAPVPILMRVLPGKDKSFNNWLSTTAGTFFEVFVRVFVVYMIALIARQLPDIVDRMFASGANSDAGFGVKVLTKAFLFMGVIAFAKQAPKMISDLLGIQAGDMKLGIRDKLKEGGGFAAAGAVGAGVTTGVRNGFAAGRNIKQAKGIRKVGAAFRGVGSVAAGAVSGGVRGAVGGNSAKTYGELATNTSKATQDAIDKRNARESYRQEHQILNDDGTRNKGEYGVAAAHVADAWSSLKNWATGDSTQSLQDRRNKVKGVQDKYAEVFSAIKKDVQENEASYLVDPTDEKTTVSSLRIAWQAAEEKAKKTGNAADLEAAEIAQNKYNKGLEAAIEWQNKFERGEVTKGAKRDIKNDGTFDKDSIKHVANISVAVNAADEAIQANRAEIMKLAEAKFGGSSRQEDIDNLKMIKTALEQPNSVIDKKARNAIGDLVNEMDIEINKRRQQEDKNKK